MPGLEITYAMKSNSGKGNSSPTAKVRASECNASLLAGYATSAAELGKTKGCVTPPQRACRAMRRQAGDMFERSESLTAQALATNSERQATKRLKDVLVTPEQSKWRPARRQPEFFASRNSAALGIAQTSLSSALICTSFEYFFSKKYIKTLLL